MFRDIRVMQAIAGHLIIEYARGHHNVSVLEVARCQICLQVSPSILVKLLQLPKHHWLLDRFRDKHAFLYELSFPHRTGSLSLRLRIDGLCIIYWSVLTGMNIIVVGIQIITHFLIETLSIVVLVLAGWFGDCLEKELLDGRGISWLLLVDGWLSGFYLVIVLLFVVRI